MSFSVARLNTSGGSGLNLVVGASTSALALASSTVCLGQWYACAVVIGWSISPDLKERSIEDLGFFWGLLRICGQSVVVLRIQVFSYFYFFLFVFAFSVTKIYWFLFIYLFFIISGFMFLDLGLCSCCSCSRHT